jgi:hypothetical protein
MELVGARGDRGIGLAPRRVGCVDAGVVRREQRPQDAGAVHDRRRHVVIIRGARLDGALRKLERNVHRHVPFLKHFRRSAAAHQRDEAGNEMTRSDHWNSFVGLVAIEVADTQDGRRAHPRRR